MALQPMTLDEIKANVSQVVELPPFENGAPLRVRMRRPNLFALMNSGRIPNALLPIAMRVVDQGMAADAIKPEDLPELNKLLDILLDAAFVEPKWSEIQDYLSMEQVRAALAYVNLGVKALERFRGRLQAVAEAGGGSEEVGRAAELLSAGAEHVGGVPA